MCRFVRGSVARCFAVFQGGDQAAMGIGLKAQLLWSRMAGYNETRGVPVRPIQQTWGFLRGMNMTEGREPDRV